MEYTIRKETLNVGDTISYIPPTNVQSTIRNNIHKVETQVIGINPDGKEGYKLMLPTYHLYRGGNALPTQV